MPDMPEDEDERLEMLFRPAAVRVADDGFSERVMHRIALRAWQRRVVLAAAGATGIAVAWQPLWNLVGWLSRQLVVGGSELAVLGGRWPAVAGILENRYVIYAAAIALVIPGVVRWLEE